MDSEWRGSCAQFTGNSRRKPRPLLQWEFKSVRKGREYAEITFNAQLVTFRERMKAQF
jgi:hypothetical protein